MRAVYKPDEITSAPFEEVMKIARAGLGSLLGHAPDEGVVCLVVAKITLESGRRGTELLTSCHCGNVGNIKAGEEYEGMFTLYACNEILKGEVVWFAPEGRLSGKGGRVVRELHLLPPEGDGHPQCRFRAYANVVDGLYEYLDFIWRESYRSVRDALLTGSPTAYVHALKLKGYFTASEATYGRAVASIHAEYMARVAGRPAPVISIPDLTGHTVSEDAILRGERAMLDAAFVERGRQVAEQSFTGEFAPEELDTAVLPKGQNQA